MKTLLLLSGSIVALWCPMRVDAQQQFNGSNSNFAGLGGVLWNPATVADNRYVVQFQLAGLDGHCTNSALRYDGPWSYWQPTADFSLHGTHAVPLVSDHPKDFSTGVQLRGPGLLVRLGPKSGLALQTRVRTAFQGNDLSQSVLKNAAEGFYALNHWGNSTFNANFNAVAEWDVAYGRVLVDQGAHFWKVGLAGKRLMGLGSAYVQGRNVDYEVVANPLAPGNPVLVVHQLDGAYGYSTLAGPTGLDLSTAQRWLLGQDATGHGWGADIGVVYEYRPARGVNPPPGGLAAGNYLYRVSAAVTDVGWVSYDTNTAAFPSLSIKEGALPRADYQDITLDTYATKLNQLFGPAGAPKQDRYVARMPAALNVDVDYHVGRRWYVNASLSQGLLGARTIGLRTLSFASLTPRLEGRRFELAVPLSLANDYQLPAVGLLLRLGPVALGSNNLSAFWASAHPYGANVYAQVSLLQVVAKDPNQQGPKKRKQRSVQVKRPGNS